jgi:hypothetical protein
MAKTKNVPRLEYNNNPRKRQRESSSETPGSGWGGNNRNIMVGPDVLDNWDDSSRHMRGPTKQTQRGCERGPRKQMQRERELGKQNSGGNLVDTDESSDDSESGSSGSRKKTGF